MSNFISTYSMNINELKLIDGEYKKSEDWCELIDDEDSSFTREEEMMVFDCFGVEVVVWYTLSVQARVDYDPGDYWTPPYSDVDIISDDITIDSLYVDEYEVELTKDIKIALEKEIKKYL